jgi:uncharacterized membrane protein AbrB (regulator of aidB expression)
MKKEKAYSVIVMVVSLLILLFTMYLGKTMGRDISNQQAYLKEQFPVINTKSEAEVILENISPEELQHLSNQSTRIVILVITASISVMVMLIVTKRFHKQLTAV